MILFYKQETSYMKWKTNNAKWGVSIKMNNENENYILHFIFHTNFLHIKSSRIPVMENNINITYQVMGRQQITQNIIHENSTRKIYSSILIISLNKCESDRI